MTAGVMLLSFGAYEYQSSIVDRARIVERLETDSTALDQLYARGVDYVYIGQRGDVDGPGLDPMLLAQAERAELVYHHTGVYLFEILPPQP